MLGETSLGETALGGETLDLGVPIIEEVPTVTKTLVFVVEVDLFQPSDATPSEPEPPTPEPSGELLAYASVTVAYGGQDVEY